MLNLFIIPSNNFLSTHSIKIINYVFIKKGHTNVAPIKYILFPLIRLLYYPSMDIKSKQCLLNTTGRHQEKHSITCRADDEKERRINLCLSVTQFQFRRYPKLLIKILTQLLVDLFASCLSLSLSGHINILPPLNM